MISDVAAGKIEGWSYIDKMPAAEICGGFAVDELPNVLHFCQRYGMGKYFFGKRKLPRDFLSCESPLLAEPPHDLLQQYNFAIFPQGNRKEWNPTIAKRNAFVLCYMIPALNAAATYYKKNRCDSDIANYKKDLIFFDSLDVTRLT
jgi:peptidyl serine alpha-galactosyltransferase